MRGACTPWHPCPSSSGPSIADHTRGLPLRRLPDLGSLPPGAQDPPCSPPRRRGRGSPKLEVEAKRTSAGDRSGAQRWARRERGRPRGAGRGSGAQSPGAQRSRPGSLLCSLSRGTQGGSCPLLPPQTRRAAAPRLSGPLPRRLIWTRANSPKGRCGRPGPPASELRDRPPPGADPTRGPSVRSRNF